MLLLSLVTPAISRPKEPIKTGYLVVITKDCKYSAIKTESLTEVYTLAETVFPGNCLQVEKVLKTSPYFDIYNSEKGIYIEKKRITKNGKYRRLK
jgi:hypothetical protein